MEKVHALVLNHANYRESDRMLTLLSLEKGKITASARGCRKPGSRLMAATDYLVFGEFMLRPLGRSYTVTSCNVIDSFYQLRENMDALSCAFYLRDFCELAAPEADGDAGLLGLIVRALSALCHGGARPETVRTAFEVKALQLLGLLPSLSACVRCGGQLGTAPRFSVEDGGAVCPACQREGDRPVLPGSLAALNKLLTMDFDGLRVYRLSPAVMRDLAGFWRAYILWHVSDRLPLPDGEDAPQRSTSL